METSIDKKKNYTKEKFVTDFLDKWTNFVESATRLVVFPRKSYVEVYESKQCRWKLGIVKRFSISEDSKVWLKLYIPATSQTKSVDLTDKLRLQCIKWSRGRKVEVKDGDTFYPGVVILTKTDEDGMEWLGMEYLDPHMKLKRVKVNTKYCPKLFRPLQGENGIRFGYSVELTSVFFDPKIGSYRYVLHVKGPGKSWRVAKNFRVMRSFWNSIRKYVGQRYPGIVFPKGKLFGFREKKFIVERKKELATFWRRLTRMLHLIDDEPLQKITKFLEIPFVSQKQYKKGLKEKTYIKLMKLENLPVILDDQEKEKPNCTYVRMKINDDLKSNVDVEEWLTRVDSVNPVWNSTRALATNGDKLTIEVWQDNFGKQPDFKIAKLVISKNQLEKNQKAAISIRVSTRVKPNPCGKCKVFLQIVNEPPKEKWVYLIRHGQSKWNAAKREFDLLTAFGIIDHGLTKKGANQAEELREKINSEEFRNDKSPLYKHFYEATSVLASPLSRAAESAVLALRDHDGVKENGISLFSGLREKRQLMGMDCTGQFRGKEIIPHIHREFKEIGYEEEKDSDVYQVNIDPNDSEHQWWNVKAETQSGFAERVDHAIRNIMYSQAESIIVVCHSMVIRHIFRSYLSPEFHRVDEVAAHDLSYEKLQNMGIAGMRLDTSKLQCIQEAALMFGSVVLYHKKDKQEKRGSVVDQGMERAPSTEDVHARVDFRKMFNNSFKMEQVAGIADLNNDETFARVNSRSAKGSPKKPRQLPPDPDFNDSNRDGSEEVKEAVEDDNNDALSKPAPGSAAECSDGNGDHDEKTSSTSHHPQTKEAAITKDEKPDENAKNAGGLDGAAGDDVVATHDGDERLAEHRKEEEKAQS